MNQEEILTGGKTTSSSFHTTSW